MYRSLISNRYLAYTLIANEIRKTYWGSFFGILGTFLNPLIILSIYTFVFSGILKIKFGTSSGMGNFAVYLFCGLIPWMGFSEAVQRSSTILLDKKPLLKQTKFPKQLLPFCLTFSAFINQLFALSAFLIVLIFIRIKLNLCGFLLVIFFPFQLLFTFSFCLIVSSLNIFLRDIGIFLSTFLQLWFFCTPIFYPESIIPNQILPVMKINPMFHLVKIYRSLLLDGQLPPLASIAWFLISSIGLIMLASLIFNWIENKIVDYL
jgi:ABC-type polysaccharide/polyol phosphate export permease